MDKELKEVIELITSDESIKAGKPIIGFLEISIKIFHYINQLSYNNLALSPCNLFIECVKNDTFSQEDYNHPSISLNTKSTEEMSLYFKKSIGEFLASEEHRAGFILSMLQALGYEPMRALKEGSR